MRRKGVLSWVVGASVLFVAFVFLTSVGLCADNGQKAKTLNIGLIYGLTGFSAGSERIMDQGGHLAADYVNQRGGITIKGEKYLINVITEDHKSTAEGAAGAATKLVYDAKVKFIAGAIMPFSNIAINSVTEPAKILHAAEYNVASPTEYSPKTPYTFVTFNGTVEGITTMLTYIAEAHPEVKTLALSHPDDGCPPYVQPHAARIAKERGMNLMGDLVTFSLDTVDFTALAKKMMARNPDAIGMINGWPSMTGGVLKVAREAGYTKPIFITTYQQPEDTIKVAGKDASTNFYQHGEIAMDPGNPPIMNEITRMTRAKYGELPIHGVFSGFDNLWMLIQAIEAAQSLDPTEVRNKWEKMDTMKSVWGVAHVGGLKTYGIRHTMTHPIPIVGLINGSAKTMKWLDITAP